MPLRMILPLSLERECSACGQDEEVDLEIEVDYTAGSPGCTYGPPERCYEAEPDCIEVVAMFDAYTGEPWRGRLTPPEVDLLTEMAGERARDEREAMAEDAAERGTT